MLMAFRERRERGYKRSPRPQHEQMAAAAFHLSAREQLLSSLAPAAFSRSLDKQSSLDQASFPSSPPAISEPFALTLREPSVPPTPVLSAPGAALNGSMTLSAMSTPGALGMARSPAPAQDATRAQDEGKAGRKRSMRVKKTSVLAAEA